MASAIGSPGSLRDQERSSVGHKVPLSLTLWNGSAWDGSMMGAFGNQFLSKFLVKRELRKGEPLQYAEVSLIPDLVKSKKLLLLRPTETPRMTALKIVRISQVLLIPNPFRVHNGLISSETSDVHRLEASVSSRPRSLFSTSRSP